MGQSGFSRAAAADDHDSVHGRKILSKVYFSRIEKILRKFVRFTTDDVKK